MKTFQTTVVIATFTILMNLTANATENKNTTGKKSSKEHAAIVEMFGFGKAVEQRLIEEYLKEQRVEMQTLPKKAYIYSANGELAYEGEADSEKAAVLLHKADFLMELGDGLYFRIHE